ncbi:polysaccharide biosynthesis tyrosine autokinase [Onishia taeanensis]
MDNKSNKDGSLEIDVMKILFPFIVHYKFIIIFTLTFFVVGFLYSESVSPVYEADALVQVERRSTISPFGDGIVGEGTSNSTAAEIEILRSRLVLGQVVESLSLDVVVQPTIFPFLSGLFINNNISRPEMMESTPWVWGGEFIQDIMLEVSGEYEGMPLKLVADGMNGYLLLAGDMVMGKGRAGSYELFDNNQISLYVGKINAGKGATFIIQKLSVADAIDSLSANLAVDEVGGPGPLGTGILTLSLKGNNRFLLQKTLNSVAAIFLSQNVERESKEAQQSLAFLENQAPRLREQLVSAENSLNEYRVQLDSVNLDSESEAVIDRYVEIEEQLSSLEFQGAELSQRFTRSHPTYQALLRQKQILESEKDKLNERVKELPTAQQEILRKTREVEVTQAIYLSVLNKIQEMKVAKAGTVGNVRVIDEALVNHFPVSPNKPLIVIISTLLGLILSLSLIIAKTIFNRGIEFPEQVESAGLPLYATIPFSEAQKKYAKHIRVRNGSGKGEEVVSDIIALKNQSDITVEAIKGLRTSMHFALLEAVNRRVMITGPTPSVGKTFITANLSAVCAQAGQRVLIIDADMRRGRLHHAFKGKSECGLCEFLTNSMSFEEIIKPSGVTGLSYISRGVIPPNPSELLMSDNFDKLLVKASDDFDLVILDTPPVLAVTDASIVGSKCDSTLMVIRYQGSSVKEVKVSIKRLEMSGVRVSGAIFNGFEPKASKIYGYEYFNYAS